MYSSEELVIRQQVIEQIHRNKVFEIPTIYNDFVLDYDMFTDTIICVNYKKKRKRNPIELPFFVEKIDKNCFNQLRFLEGINLHKNLKEIDNYAFYLCDKMYSVDFGICDDLERIGDSAFYYCQYLNNITINNNSLNYIGANSFKDCICLKTIDINSPLKKIDKGAFLACKSLNKINIKSSEDLIIGEDGFLTTNKSLNFNISANNILFLIWSLSNNSFCSINITSKSNRVMFYPNSFTHSLCDDFDLEYKNFFINDIPVSKKDFNKIVNTKTALLWENGELKII